MFKVATTGKSISEFRVRGVQALVCQPLLSVGEYTTIGGVAIMYGDKGYLFHKGSNVAKNIEAWIQKEISSSHFHCCTVCVQREQREQYLHEAERKRD